MGADDTTSVAWRRIDAVLAREMRGVSESSPNSAMKQGTKKSPSLRPRFQLSSNGDISLGPGKADLLELIGATGSISEAASRMGMSYMRAWTLVRTMNGSFREPLVTMVRGGRSKGGSQLSDTGREVLNLYRRLESEARRATRATERSLLRLLREP